MPANTDGDQIAIGDVYRALADLGRLIDAIVADDRLSDAEVTFLAQWLEASKAIADVPPASTIHRRIGEMLHDGVLSGEEKQRLLEELKMHAASAPVVSGG